MKKASLDGESSPQIIHRIMQLQPDTSPIWGKLSVEGMLYHCATIHRSILSNDSNPQKPNLKQRMISTLVLKMMKQLPKGIKTNPKFLQPKEDTTLFEERRKSLVITIEELLQREDIYGTHPFLGPLNTQQWRRFIYMHLDHHLRQFGV